MWILNSVFWNFLQITIEIEISCNLRKSYITGLLIFLNYSTKLYCMQPLRGSKSPSKPSPNRSRSLSRSRSPMVWLKNRIANCSYLFGWVVFFFLMHLLLLTGKIWIEHSFAAEDGWYGMNWLSWLKHGTQTGNLVLSLGCDECLDFWLIHPDLILLLNFVKDIYGLWWPDIKTTNIYNVCRNYLCLVSICLVKETF